MRPSVRLFQSVVAKGTPRLMAFHPTGITGVLTHPAPRSTILSVYNATLKKLQEIPEESAYRTATEAIVKYRKKAVESQIPAGWDEHLKDLESRGLPSPPLYDDGVEVVKVEGRNIIAGWGKWEGSTEDEQEYTGWVKLHLDKLKEAKTEEWETKHGRKAPNFENIMEPDISLEQVREIEAQVGGGLIEELIEQAYEELKLVDTMVKAKAWEPLMEEPVDGQWVYFERKNQ